MTGRMFLVSWPISPAFSPIFKIPHQKDMIPSIVMHRETASFVDSSAPFVTASMFPWSAAQKIPAAIMPAHR